MPDTPATAKLRRIALQHQGLLSAAPFGRGLNGTLRAIEHLGYVQIDTISVVNRAHDHVLHSRVPGYRGAHLDALQARGRIFEYWWHAAAYLPMRDYRFALPKMRAMARGEDRWIRSRDRQLMRRVLERVRADGPLQARDFEAPAGASGGWWAWKPAKQALEQLFMEGELMVAGRRGFQKVYDLAERVLPGDVDTREPALDEIASHLIERTLSSHGFTSLGEIVYLRRSPALREAVRAGLDEAVRAGALTAFSVPGATERLYARPDVLARRAAQAPARARVLSPFDNAVIQRRRVRTLFDFDYQLECYLPDGKRRFGYFCLPLQFRDHFLGRADCKAHRERAQLEIKRLFVEDQTPLRQEPDRLLPALADALTRFARFNGCTSVTLDEVHPAFARVPIRRALAQHIPEEET